MGQAYQVKRGPLGVGAANPAGRSASAAPQGEAGGRPAPHFPKPVLVLSRCLELDPCQLQRRAGPLRSGARTGTLGGVPAGLPRGRDRAGRAARHDPAGGGGRADAAGPAGDGTGLSLGRWRPSRTDSWAGRRAWTASSSSGVRPPADRAGSGCTKDRSRGSAGEANRGSSRGPYWPGTAGWRWRTRDACATGGSASIS